MIKFIVFVVYIYNEGYLIKKHHQLNVIKHTALP